MRAAIVLLLLLAAAGDAGAQTSIYGIRGLGYPGRAVNTRARALGGGVALLDGGSVINPAAVAGFTTIAVEVMAESDFRTYTIGPVSADGLSSTRFPLVQLGGPLGSSRLSFGVSYSQYTERSYDLTLNDTIQLRGAPVGYEERTTSRGGVSDLRGAVAYRLGERFRLGAALHVLTGSAKLTFTRVFADSAYRPYQIEGEEAVTGLGVSTGAMWAATNRLLVGVSARADSRAKLRVDSVEAGTIDLPLSLGAGVQYVIAAPLRWSGSVMWRSWGSADDDLVARAFDTWELGTGLELGGTGTGSRFPLRIGYRYATLPFSYDDRQPHEFGLSAGVGLAFAGNRGVADLAVERLIRRGAGADERAWQVTWTVTVRP